MSLPKFRIFLQLIAIAHIVGGILLPFLVNTQLFSTYNALVNQALGFETTGKSTDINFLIGLFGPTIPAGESYFYTLLLLLSRIWTGEAGGLFSLAASYGHLMTAFYQFKEEFILMLSST
jgi:hypothetical protein